MTDIEKILNDDQIPLTINEKDCAFSKIINDYIPILRKEYPEMDSGPFNIRVTKQHKTTQIELCKGSLRLLGLCYTSKYTEIIGHSWRPVNKPDFYILGAAYLFTEFFESTCPEYKVNVDKSVFIAKQEEIDDRQHLAEEIKKYTNLTVKK